MPRSATWIWLAAILALVLDASAARAAGDRAASERAAAWDADRADEPWAEEQPSPEERDEAEPETFDEGEPAPFDEADRSAAGPLPEVFRNASPDSQPTRDADVHASAQADRASGAREPKPLERRKSKPLRLSPSGAEGTSKRRLELASPAMMLGSLALVVGLFCLVALLLRRSSPRGAAALPREAFEVLGRAPLAGRLHAHLLRLGNRLLLVTISPGGAETLCEINDPAEVERLLGVCEQLRAGSATTAFRQALQQFSGSRRPPRRGRDSYDEFDAGQLDGFLAEETKKARTHA